MDVKPPAAELVRRLAEGSPAERVEAAKELARRKDRTLLPELAHTLRTGSAHAREMAAWLLGELSPGTEFTIDALHATISDPDASESLRGQAIESLGNQVSHLRGGDIYERAADSLIALLQQSSVEIRFNAVFALGAMRCVRARQALLRIAADDHRAYRGLQTVSECAHFSIECIDYEPHGTGSG
jgi:HEAT repeat protein